MSKSTHSQRVTTYMTFFIVCPERKVPTGFSSPAHLSFTISFYARDDAQPTQTPSPRGYMTRRWNTNLRQMCVRCDKEVITASAGVSGWGLSPQHSCSSHTGRHPPNLSSRLSVFKRCHRELRCVFTCTSPLWHLVTTTCFASEACIFHFTDPRGLIFCSQPLSQNQIHKKITRKSFHTPSTSNKGVPLKRAKRHVLIVS